MKSATAKSATAKPATAKPATAKPATAKSASAKPVTRKATKPAPPKGPGAASPAAAKKTSAPRPRDLALAVGKTALGSGTPGVVTLDLPGRAMLSVGTTKYALLVRDRDAVLVDLLLPEARRGAEAKALGFSEDVSRPGWARIRLGQAADAWQAAQVSELARETIARLGGKPAPAPAPAPSSDPFRSVADALVAALSAARGHATAEEAAMRAAIAAYVAIAEDGDPDRLGVVGYLAEDGSAQNPPAIERVPGCTEADTFRWRTLLLDLVDY